MNAAFLIGKQHSDGFDVLFIRQILQARLANFVDMDAIQPVGHGLEIHLFQLVVAQSQKAAVLSGHRSPPSNRSCDYTSPYRGGHKESLKFSSGRQSPT